MRTAVVRIRVDEAGELSAEQLVSGMAELGRRADDIHATVIDNNLAGLPPSRREVELLMSGADVAALQQSALALCAKIFGTKPTAGTLTFVSHGTDDDAHGVLAGFGLTALIERLPDDRGWDIVTVTLKKADLQRIPESRIHTALEASLNCEVRIITV